MKQHIIIGTAGHVDHGKTALIRALTGRDTDRLEEEKRRGITIDLGFTWIDLPNGMRAGMIDVPGHERFISNMTAGVTGMDLVLLVIAADEGIMPQTKEHLAILQMLGVENYIIVINKCDLADSEWIEFLKEEIQKEIQSAMEIVCVSAKTGKGIDQLKKTICSCVEKKEQMWKTSPFPRLPVDRVFTVRGAGTVVTGTLLGGSVRKEDQLMIYPDQTMCRIREIQVHGDRVEQCEAGQRVAFNLSGVNKKQDVSTKILHRGTVLAKEGSLSVGKIFNVRLQVLKDSKREIGNQTRLHFFSGTSEVLCRAVPLEKETLRPGESGYAQLRMEEEIALCRGDRFVIRFYSPLETIGGGVILETNARKERRFQEKVIERLRSLEEGNESERVEQYLLQQGKMLPAEQFVQEIENELKISKTETENILQELRRKKLVVAISVKGQEWLWSAEEEEKLRQQIQATLLKWLADHPYYPGMPKAEFVSRVSQELKKKSKAVLADAYTEWLVQNGILEKIFMEKEISRNIRIAPKGYEVQENEIYRKIREFFYRKSESSGMEFFEITDFADKRLLSEKDSKKLRKEDLKAIFELMEYRNEAVKITETVYTVPEIAEEIRNRVNHLLEQYGKITIIQTKELFGTGRKNAKRILEYTDRIGMTKKEGAETERTDNRKIYQERREQKK